MDHTVVPPVGMPASSTQRKAVPPHSWISIPRCFLYQLRSATGSLALRKTPPIPVTRLINTSALTLLPLLSFPRGLTTSTSPWLSAATPLSSSAGYRPAGLATLRLPEGYLLGSYHIATADGNHQRR